MSLSNILSDNKRLKDKTIFAPLPVPYLVLGLFDVTAFIIVSATTFGEEPFLSALVSIFIWMIH